MGNNERNGRGSKEWNGGKERNGGGNEGALEEE